MEVTTAYLGLIDLHQLMALLVIYVRVVHTVQLVRMTLHCAPLELTILQKVSCFGIVFKEVDLHVVY